MEKRIFQERLSLTTRIAVEDASKYVIDDLPASYIYIIFPNRHNPLKQITGDAEVYPEDSLEFPFDQFLGPFDENEVVNYLWRNGKVPEWIDINVHSVKERATVLSLVCCGHFTAVPDNDWNGRVYKYFLEHSPFSVRGPAIPWEFHKQGSPKFKLKEYQESA